MSDGKVRYMSNIYTFRDQVCDKEMNLGLVVRNIHTICTWRSSIKYRSSGRSFLGSSRRSRTHPSIPTLTFIFSAPTQLISTTPKEHILICFLSSFPHRRV